MTMENKLFRFPNTGSRLLGAILSGLALGAGLLSWNVFWISWLALIPFFLALTGTRWKMAALIGFLTGFSRACVTWHWLAPTVNLLSNGFFSGLLVYTAVAIGWGLVIALLAIALSALSQRYRRMTKHRPYHSTILILLSAALWTLFEYGTDAISNYLALIFFPTLGFSQWGFLPILQIASFTGIYGVSFIIVVWNGAWSCMISEKAKRPFLAILLLIASFTGIEALMLKLRHGPEMASKRVAILQGNVKPFDKLDDTKGQTIGNHYLELCRAANADKADLVVWTEGAIPWQVTEGDPFLERVLSLTASSHSTHLVGMWLPGDKIDSNAFYNSALLILADGRVVDAYQKTKLIPMVERPVTLFNRNWSFAPQAGPSRFLSGTGTKTMQSPIGKLGVTICNETFYSYLTRDLVRGGAEVLINIGNDAWSKGNTVCGQHFGVNIIRAVESGRYLVAANNCGISGIIDNHGRILTKSAPWTRVCATGAIVPLSGTTLFSRFGNWFMGVCLLGLVAGLVNLLVSGRKKEASPT